jgi:hypothetical protein
MNVRRMPIAPPNRPASKTTLSRGAASPGTASGEAPRRPVVLGEDEGGEVDFVGQLDQPIERREARVEDGRPRVDVGDVPEAARQGRQELLLLPR